METIVNKIKKSVQSGTGLTCLYGSLDSINVQMGDQTDFPVAFFVLLNNGSLDNRSSNYRERVDVAMFFVKPTEFDFESIENEAIISECKQCAFQWLNSLFLGGDLRYITTLNTSRVYNQMDDILTGYALRVRLEELVGECINIPKPDPPRPNYLRFTALEDDSVIGWTGTYPNLEYSTDGSTWTAFTEPVTVNTGDKVMFRNNGTAWTATKNNSHFTTTGSVDISGNIMSLVDPTLETTSLSTTYCFRSLFRKCTGIVSAENLELADNTWGYCYAGMFFDCTNLETAPELPATTLAQNCYSQMFSGCTAITSAPELPATTLAQSCYSSMFQNCTSLTSAPELPALTLYIECYQYMFSGCTNLVDAPSVLPATSLAQYSYDYMFYGCTSLTEAPELPATTLKNYCYAAMFYGCTSLNYIKCLATNISATGCTYNWLYNVSATGTFAKAQNVVWPTGTSGIPSGWTVVENTDNG